MRHRRCRAQLVMRIELAGASVAAAAPRRAARGPRDAGSFAVVADDGDDLPEMTGAPALSQAAGLALLGAAQAAERQGGGAQRDRLAAGHGKALLGALAGLQAATLGGGQGGARRTLTELAGSLPEASDPGLSAVLQAIAQRAAIELARSE